MGMEAVLLLLNSRSGHCIVLIQKLRLCIAFDQLVGSQTMREFIACVDTFIPEPGILLDFGVRADRLSSGQFKSEGSILCGSVFRCSLVLCRCHNY